MFRVLDGTRHRSNARYRRISRNSVITRSWIFILVPSSGFMVDRSTTSVHNEKERDRTNDERLGARTREFRGAGGLTSEWKGKARVVRQGSQFKRSRNTKLLYLRSFVRFVSPGEAIFLLYFLDMPRFSIPLYLVILPRPMDLGVAFKAMEKQMSRRSREAASMISSSLYLSFIS